MKPPFASLVLTCALTAGCAMLAGPPPAPPLAVPAIGAPREFTLAPIKWRPGLVLTYQIHAFTETNPGGTDHERQVIQMKGVDKTAKGAVRVQFLVDDLDLGSMLIDKVGHVQGAIAATPESAAGITALAEAMQISLLRRRPSKPFTVGETFTWELPATWLRRLMPPEWGSHLPSRLTVRGQFVGYVRLGDALAAAVRFETPNMLRSPIRTRDRNNHELRIDVLVAEGVEYFDAMAGYSLAKYEVLTGGGELGGKPCSVRAVFLTTLDRARSSGLQHAGTPVPASPPRVPKQKDETASGTVGYELTREDLPSAESLRSTSLSVFGVKLGSSYDDMFRAVSGIGRPVRETPLKGASMKSVSIYSGDDEARAGHRMALFVARDNVIEEIHLNGTDRPFSRQDAPVYRGFDSIAAGRTRDLLNECMTNARLSILGGEDRATRKEFPGGHGSFFRRYEYDKAGLDLSHLRLTREPAYLGEQPDLYEHCTLRLRNPGKPQ
jgi:hypothetical protein